MAEFRRVQLRRWVETNGLGGKRVLEIGTGRGEYLPLLAEAGVTPFGTEGGAHGARACADEGWPVQHVFPEGEDVVLEHGPFDAFASFNFMEHWPRPREVLRCVARHLVDGAIGLVEVPDFDMILRQRLLTEFIADHLMYFTRETFGQALRLSGFEVLRMDSVWHGYILSAVVRKRAPLSVRGFEQWRAETRVELDRFVDAHRSRGVAVWGAGHQALASLAAFSLGDKIAYVVDSAPFKQGRFTPATHLPIDAPERLLTQPVGAILVMAAAYATEVVARIERELVPRWRAEGVELPALAVLGEHGLERR
jgi:SAM-dependent methyltransferase